MPINTNDSFANTIITTFADNNIKYFCIAPGSRSTPLALACAKHPMVKTFVHFDERGLGFHALGYAKATNNPCAIIVTSGTALGNLYPAVMEAYHSQTSLILLTADRTFEDRDCFSNQATTQVSFFQTFAKWHCDLPPPCDYVTLNTVKSKINHAAYISKLSPMAPVQINCMFRKPLTSPFIPIKTTSPIHHVGDRTIDSHVYQTIAEKIDKAKTGLILIGSMPANTDVTPIINLAKKLGFCIFADLLCSCFPKRENQIQHFDLLLKNIDLHPPDIILHFGKAFISKHLLDWFEKKSFPNYLHIDQDSYHFDPAKKVTEKICCHPISFAKQLIDIVIEKKQLASDLIHLDKRIDSRIKKIFEKQSEITEPLAFHLLNSFLQEDVALFIGNSMPIRNADRFLSSSKKLTIFANRGLSGIDGNIATCIGIANGLKKPVIALMGDLTFLHDLNSLSQIKNSNYPVTFIIFNNSGGAIFSMLPVRSEKKHFEKHFQAKHDYNFKHISKQFSLPYYVCDSLRDSYKKLFSSISSCIIEVRTDSKKDFNLLEELLDHAILQKSAAH